MRRHRSILLATLFTASAFALLQGEVPLVQSGTWGHASAMSAPRGGAAAALMPNGGVLVTGGVSSGEIVASTSLFDPISGFTTDAEMHVARTDHAAVTLADGSVLVIGGRTADGATASAELYAGGVWSDVGSLAEPRWGHTATLLSDGRVLVTGGQGAIGAIASVEVFDPTTATFSLAGSLTSGRYAHAAAPLADGRVVIAGGFDGERVLQSIDVFDPSTGTITSGPSLTIARGGLSATTLLDGTVLFFGGNDGTNDLASAELFDPTTGVVSAAASASAARRDHQAFLLPNNNSVLVVGGMTSSSPSASAELYMPSTNEFRSTGALNVARSNASGAPLLQDGLLLVAGGDDLASSELYGFATVKTDYPEYIPGDVVTITGGGWQPGETVTLRLRETPEVHEDRIFTAVADESGRIANSEFVVEEHHLGVRFFLTATGAGSQALNTFADAPKVGSVVVGSQNPAAITPGSTATYTITINRGTGTGSTGAFSASLSASGLPAGATASFSPATVSFNGGQDTRTSTLTISTTVATGYGSSPFSVQALSGLSDSASGSGTLIVRRPTATSVTSSLNPSSSGASVTFTATVTSTAGGNPTGTVTFFDGAASIGTDSLNPAGKANLATSALSAGSHSITAVYAGDTAYIGSTSPALTQTVNAAVTTLLTASPATGTYGSTVSLSASLTASGSPVNGKTIAFSLNGNAVCGGGTGMTCPTTNASGVATLANVSLSGINANLYASGVSASFAGDTSFLASTGAASLTVSQRPITVAADPKSKVYGDADPTLTYEITDGTLAGSDSLSGALARAAGENVGSYAILQGTLTAGNNYNLTFVGANLSITPRGITVAASPKSKVYGDADPALTHSITVGNLVNGDSLAGALTRDAGENVGPYAITQGTLTAGTNYNLTFVGATLSITTRPIAVTADAKSKTYGDADPTLTYQLTSGSLAFSDAFAGSPSRVGGESVGAYAIQQGTLALGSNYDLTFVEATLTINPRALAVTADAQTKTYGAADPALTYQATGFQFADTAATVLSGGLARAAGQTVGSYAINQGSLAANDNYTIDFTGANLTITPRTVVGHFTADDKTYDGTPNATIGNRALDNVVTEDSLVLVGGTASFADKHVGTNKLVTGTGFTLDGADAANYVLASSTLTTNANIEPRALVVNASGQDKPYDGTTAATVALSDDRLSGDTFDVSYASATFSDKNVGSNKPVSVNGVSISGPDAGNYTASASASTTADITPRSASVTPGAATKTYGSTDPVLSGNLLGFVDADDITATYTRTAGETVSGGPYPISGTLSPAAALSNYDITYSTANFSITPKAASVTPNAATKVYGALDPSLTGVVAGFLATDNVAASYGRASGETAGDYIISATLTPAGVLSNYAITSNTAMFTITKKPASVTPNAKTKAFGAPDPVLDGVLSGFLPGDGVTAAYSRTSGEQVENSPYLISATLSPAGVLGNYDITYNTATFTIAAWSLAGFYQPVGEASSKIQTPGSAALLPAATTVWNTVKNGSTVPFKFNVFVSSGGTELTNVADVIGFTATKVGCTAGAEDPVDVEFVTTGATALRYDTTAHQFIQNWQTPKGAGSCYRVTMMAKDGSTISAFFKTK
jgi:hypothetical protein